MTHESPYPRSRRSRATGDWPVRLAKKQIPIVKPTAVRLHGSTQHSGNSAAASLPRLLVSVRDPLEAIQALAGGADWIDIKEPAHGPLGMASPQVISKIVQLVGAQAPVSAALGEWLQWESHSQPTLDANSLAMVKAGLAGAAKVPHWREKLGAFMAHWPAHRMIAVAYADAHRCDAPEPQEVLTWACQQPAAGLLIDTAVKDGKNLFDWLTAEQVKTMVDQCRRAGRLIALAGSLRKESLQLAASLGPDLVAVRGAVCLDGNRRAGVQRDLVAQVRQLIATSASPAVSAGD